MEYIVKSGNTVEWRGLELNYVDVRKINDNMVHIMFNDRLVCFLIDDVELNGVVYNNADEFISELIKGSDFSLEPYKKEIINLIDTKSEEKIFGGFVFDNNRFSLSLSAQINWSNLLFLPESFFPVNLSTKDDDVYSLTYANVQLFYQAALNGKNAPLQEGNVLKQQVKLAITKEELDLIKNSL